MSGLGELNDALTDLIKKNVPVVLRRCTVEKLDKSNDVIDAKPVDGSPAFYDVKLKAVKDTTDSKIIAYPAEDSFVIIGTPQNNNQDAFVVQISDFDSILIELSNDFKCEVKNDGNVLLNDGNNGGLINISDLTTQINNRLNGIKASCVAAFTAQASIDSSLGLNAFNAAWPGAVPSMNKSAYEDTKIKH